MPRAAAAVATSRLAIVASSFATSVVTARSMDPAAMGHYFFVASLVLVLGVAGTSGLTAELMRRGAGHGDSLGFLVTRAYLLFAYPGSVLVLSSMLILAREPVNPTLLCGAAVWLLGAAVASVALDTLRASHQIGTYAGLVALSAIGPLVTLLGASLINELTIHQCVWIQATWQLAIIGIAMALQQRAGVTRPEAPLEFRPVVVASVMTTLYVLLAQVDLIVVGLHGGEQAGIYAVAARVASLFSLPLVVLATAVAPRIAHELNYSTQTVVEETIRRATALALGVALVAAASFLVVGDTLITVVYGEEFADAALLIALLSLGHLVNVASGLGGLVLSLKKFYGRSLLVNLVGVVIGTFLMALALAKDDLIAVAGVSACMFGLVNLALSMTAWRTTRVRVWASLTR